MKVYRSLEEVPHIGNAIVTIGNFDGVHLGHVHVLENLLLHQGENLQSMVITMWPHPRKVLHPSAQELRFLTSIDEKIELLQNLGVDHLLIIPFTASFAQLSAEYFVKEILHDCVGVKKIVLGYDHRFGKNREGGLELLHRLAPMYGFELEEIPKQEVDNLAISSSKIREFLALGQMENVTALLGRRYAMSGKVVEGNKLGRTIGFPTANISLTFPEKLVPKNGVYAVLVKVAQNQYQGMMNIGYRPTISESALTLEVHIFEFEEDIYNQYITVFFVKYLRDEQKFDSVEDLKQQLYIDKEQAISVLRKEVVW